MAYSFDEVQASVAPNSDSAEAVRDNIHSIHLMRHQELGVSNIDVRTIKLL